MADTVKTRRQLVERALAELKVIEAGQASNAEDFASMDALVDPVVAMLRSKGVIYIDDTDQIDLEVFLPLAQRIAASGWNEFGGPVIDIPAVEQQLREIASGLVTYEVLRTEYY